jgi:glycosyltransferase involved in cell wall biosynthesis
VHLAGRVAHGDVPGWIAACDVLCQPSLSEPFGQAALEGMASARSVLATRAGGPPEFVTPEAGVLVDPRDPEDMARGLEQVVGLPSPNPAAREAAAAHDAAPHVLKKRARLTTPRA